MSNYKYFYGDGFGKDFEVLNLRQETTPEQTDTLLLANLLAFHEQKRAFHAKSDAMLRYHLADPLWIFVGSTVNKSKDNKQAKESDVLTVVSFLSRVLENKRGWVPKSIRRILEGKSGIEDEGRDVFEARFKLLKGWSKDPETIYADLLRRVFHAASGGRLHVGDIKGKAGELGLKVSGSDHYFGLVYIGDTASFKALIEERCPDVEVEDDQIGEGLFENIKKPESRINVLIGAKKFMQGWDSWRVTNMGLLNIGRSEGTEIIQLFGRGVRLKGWNYSLKRSSALPTDDHPPGISLLERLNIFAIRANYMVQFRNYLEREGLDPFGELELKVPLKQSDAFLKKGLIVPRLPKDSRFADEDRFLLEADGAAKVILDLSVKVERIGSASGAFQTSSYLGGTERWVPPEQLRWLDWEGLYLDILEFKEERGFHNLVIRPEHPRQILLARDPKLYGVICDEDLLKPKRAEEAARLQIILGGVLNKYVERFYRNRQQRWDSAQMVYAPLKKDDPNFQDYVAKVPRSDPDLAKAIKDLIDEGKRLYREVVAELPNVYFDRHLYQPLLIQKGSKVKTAPPGLSESEQQFVQGLLTYCRSKPATLKDRELFLLRNLSRGRGVGFFEDSGFYPDFILWVTHGKFQRLVFVEPHGMVHEEHPSTNRKVNLHERLRADAAGILDRSKITNLELDAFVISETAYDDLRKQHGPEWDRAKYAEAHILFRDDDNHIERIIAG